MNRVLSLLIGFLFVSAIYLYTFPQANVLYAGVVLLHALAGIALSVWLLWWILRSWRRSDFLVRAGMVLLFLGAIPGLVLLYTGALRTEWNLVYVHLVVSFAGAGLIIAARLGGGRGWLHSHAALRVVIVLAVLAALAPVAGAPAPAPAPAPWAADACASLDIPRYRRATSPNGSSCTAGNCTSASGISPAAVTTLSETKARSLCSDCWLAACA